MSEVEKLYELAGVRKIGKKKCTPIEYLECQNYCFITEDNKCDKFTYNYPPFTTEKQLELIKYIASKGLVQINYWTNNCYSVSRFGCTGDKNTEFSEALANVIAKDWKSLCKEQQEEIRKILKG